MLGNKWINDASAEVSQSRQRARLVLLHQPAVADNVGSKNGGEAALNAFFCHGMWRLSTFGRLGFYGRPDGESITPDFRIWSRPVSPEWASVSAFSPKADLRPAHS